VLAHSDRVLKPQEHLKLSFPHKTKRERKWRIAETKAVLKGFFFTRHFIGYVAVETNN